MPTNDRSAPLTRRPGDLIRRRRPVTTDEAYDEKDAMLGLQESAGNRNVSDLVGGSDRIRFLEGGVLARDLARVVGAPGPTRVAVQRDDRRPTPAAIDADAQKIVDLAQDASKGIDDRATAVVNAIIRQYFPGDASKVSGVAYSASEGGLHVFMSGKGAATTGRIDVGDTFVNGTTQIGIARRVAQVHHEIEHIDQQRAGMAGKNRQDEREFEAFYHEAVFKELPGTGKIQHGTRVQLIDGALGYLCCLSDDLQKTYAAQKEELLKRREVEVKKTGHASDFGPPPTSCRRQSD
jgi:hypothetical protein